MTTAEMNRRLATMTTKKQDHVVRLINSGYNQRDIYNFRIGVTLAQVNAVWQAMDRA